MSPPFPLPFVVKNTWNPSERAESVSNASGTTVTCMTCGEVVTRRFARVFGDNGDDVHACVNCTTTRELRQGAGAE